MQNGEHDDPALFRDSEEHAVREPCDQGAPDVPALKAALEDSRLFPAVEGGAPGRCGWLKDRFGVSWQVVPRGIAEWLASPDATARDRAFAAMMGMGKPDVAALRAAVGGT